MELRVVGWMALGLVLGFTLGGMPERRELASLRKGKAELERRLANLERPNPLRMFLPALGSGATAGPPSAPGPAQPMPAATAQGVPSGEQAPDERPSPQGDVAVIGARAPQAIQGPRRREPVFHGDGPVLEPPTPPSPAEPVEEGPRRRRPRGRQALLDFDRVAAVQAARMAASRSALIEQARLDERQVAQLDSTVDRMNQKLNGYGEEVIDQMATDAPPKPAAALSLGHDVSGIMHDGQKELDSIVGEAPEGVDPQAMEIWNFVDIEQWRPFVEQKLSEGGMGPPGDGEPQPVDGEPVSTEPAGAGTGGGPAN